MHQQIAKAARTWERTVSLDLTLDWRVLVFTATLACLCAISAGVAPMFALKSVAPGEALKSAGRAIAGDRRFAVRGASVVAQIAISFVLVIAAGLFLRTFASLSQLPLGSCPSRRSGLCVSGLSGDVSRDRVRSSADPPCLAPNLR
jgi:putative ABC transport system permease protein